MKGGALYVPITGPVVEESFARAAAFVLPHALADGRQLAVAERVRICEGECEDGEREKTVHRASDSARMACGSRGKITPLIA